MTNEQSQNRGREYQIDEITYAKGGYSKCVHMRTRGRGRGGGGGGGEKSVIRYVRNKWIPQDNCCKILVAYWSRQVHKSITVTKENVAVFFHQNFAYLLASLYN